MSRSGRGHVSGPLVAYGEEFRERLLGCGYTWGSAAKQVHLVAHLSRWMEAEELDACRLTWSAVEAFFEGRRSQGCTRFVSDRAARALWGQLRAVGVGVEGEPSALLPPEPALLEAYESYLVAQRCLAAASIRSYMGVARRFLADVELSAARLEVTTAASVTAFSRRECARRAVGSAKATVTGLRAFLRFLYLERRVPTLLTAAVPSVAAWQLSSLPKTVRARELARLLASCDRRRAIGRRDFAILTVLARLGLRAEEVAVLALGDIDWRAGELTVRGKGGRVERLPLPVDVGEAVAAWLWRGRPRASVCSAVFVRLRAPHREMDSSAVSAVVRRSCLRAGVEPFGSHRLRHTAASRMLAAGASLAEVGQVLGHSRLQTTAVYAKVDACSLATLAMPWPGALS